MLDRREKNMQFIFYFLSNFKIVFTDEVFEVRPLLLLLLSCTCSKLIHSIKWFKAVSTCKHIQLSEDVAYN